MKVWIVKEWNDIYFENGIITEEDIISIYASEALAKEKVELLKTNEENKDIHFNVEEWNVIQ